MMIAALSLGMFSCSIDSPRPATGTVYVVLDNIPASVGAVALYCNLNEWKADNVNGSEMFVRPVVNGKAVFTLKNYIFAEPFKFQFTPMPTSDTKMGDDWWSYAISGSSTYGNQENNIYCNLPSKGFYSTCTITVNKSNYGPTSNPPWDSFPAYGVSASRLFNENFQNCYTVSSGAPQ